MLGGGGTERLVKVPEQDKLGYAVVTGANRCPVHPVAVVYDCGPFSGGHRITPDQVHRGRKKKEVTSYKSFVQPFFFFFFCKESLRGKQIPLRRNQQF